MILWVECFKSPQEKRMEIWKLFTGRESLTIILLTSSTKRWQRSYPNRNYYIGSRSKIFPLRLRCRLISDWYYLVRRQISLIGYFSFQIIWMCIIIVVKLFPLSFNLFPLLIAMQPQVKSSQHKNNRKHKRTHFTAFQRDKLEEAFGQSQYVSTRMRQSISQQLGLSDGSIKV